MWFSMIFPKSRCSQTKIQQTHLKYSSSKFISDFGVPNCTTFPSAFPYPLHLDHFVRLRHSEHQQFIRLLWIRKLWKLDAKHLKSIMFHNTLMMAFKPPTTTTTKFRRLHNASHFFVMKSWNSKVTSFQVLNRAMIFNKPHANPKYTHQNHQKKGQKAVKAVFLEIMRVTLPQEDSFDGNPFQRVDTCETLRKRCCRTEWEPGSGSLE